MLDDDDDVNAEEYVGGDYYHTFPTCSSSDTNAQAQRLLDLRASAFIHKCPLFNCYVATTHLIGDPVAR